MKTTAKEASQHRENALAGHRSARRLGSSVICSPAAGHVFYVASSKAVRSLDLGFGVSRKRFSAGRCFHGLVLQVLPLRCLTENTVIRTWGRGLPEYPCLSLVNSLGFSRGGYANCRVSSAKESEQGAELRIAMPEGLLWATHSSFADGRERCGLVCTEGRLRRFFCCREWKPANIWSEKRREVVLFVCEWVQKKISRINTDSRWLCPSAVWLCGQRGLTLWLMPRFVENTGWLP